ncbi:MAG: outer membrane lipoprotein carrier protein LolA [Sorangiineae bacterium]|nr:outer membrane lipoprotein carrier protein LolA [Polyangiaceae bacterium]MEB2322996.1 outer membrane lipoprotein carrier protein LolA [Sorangiineae bacterium]
MTRKSLLAALVLGLSLPVLVPVGTAEAQAGKAPPAKPAPGGTPTAAQIADRVQAFYDKTQSFAATFSQRYTVKAYSKVKKSDGRVVFAKPGKMSWRYSNSNRIVSDGKTVLVYEADNKQAYEQPMGKSQYPAALSFLVGEGNIKTAFRLKLLPAAKMKFEGGYVLEGTPKSPTPAYQKILFYVDAGTYQVRRVLLLDAQGNRNQFTFEAPVVNEKVADSEFKFTPPPGTQVIKP